MLATYPRLDVLVNNVGGFWAHRHLTADGLEHTFALNHLAPFLLTNLLLDRLIASAPARVVTVSSGAQSMGRIDFDDLMGERNYSGQRAYNQSKLANVMFTYELARRLEGTGVTANALHPGVDQHRVRRRGPGRVVSLRWSGSCGRSCAARERAPTPPSTWRAAPEVEGVTGRYFADRKAQEVEHVLLRQRGRRAAVAGQRRAGRARGLNPSTFSDPEASSCGSLASAAGTGFSSMRTVLRTSTVQSCP